MATLEKIRSKSVLLLIIIGAALIAFIIGDFFTSGRTLFGTGTTVAKVDGNSIDVQEFQRQVEQASQQAMSSGRKIDHAMLQQQVLNGMIAEKLFRGELDKLGLVVTDAELSEAMLGRGSVMLNNMLRQQGIESAAQLHDMAFNPVKYQLDEAQAAQLRQYWLSLEKQTEEQLLSAKFQNLFMGTLVANELDAKALYDENAATTHVAYVSKPFASLSDTDERFAVSDADIEKEWSAHKMRYAIPEQLRSIDYISVEIVPSAEDITAAEKRVEDAIANLNAQPDLEGVADMTDFVADRRKVVSTSLTDTRVKAFADSAAIGKAALISRMGNNFTLAKLFGRSAEVDSVNIDMVMVEGDKAKVDSVITALNAGATMEEIGKMESVRGAQDSIWVSMVDPSTASVRDAILGANTGVFFNPDTTGMAGGAQLIRVNRRKAPVPVVDVAVVTFTAEPSNATVNNLQIKLQDYIAANDNAKAFAENAQEAGYQVFPATVSASTPQITGLPETRGVISWAMDAKKGSVSRVFGDEQTGRFVVAALNDIYDDYTPARDPQVKQMLTAKLRNDKKAAALIEQYQGKAKDLAGYAQLMDVKVDSATVNFGQVNPFFPGFAGAEAAARASIAQKGQLIGPMQGLNGVVVMQVVGVDTEGRPYNFEENAILYARTRGAQVLGNNLNAVLLGNKKVQNNILKFFRE